MFQLVDFFGNRRVRMPHSWHAHSEVAQKISFCNLANWIEIAGMVPVSPLTWRVGRVVT